MRLKNKTINRRKYEHIGGPATFKADVLKMIANGQSVAYAAQSLGISEALIYSCADGPFGP